MALVPVLILVVFIYRKDSQKPEPISMIIKALLYGVASCFVSLAITCFQEESEIDSVCDAFVGAALPEEFAKLLMLWLLVRKSKYFDEPIDAIVYAACVSLGFAGLENVLYLIDEVDFLSTGIMRACFSVPGHFCFAVFMGYYYALAHFGSTHNIRNYCLAYIIPVILHGVYDGLLSLNDDDIWLFVLGGWFVFCVLLYRYSLKRISKLKEMEKKNDLQ